MKVITKNYLFKYKNFVFKAIKTRSGNYVLSNIKLYRKGKNYTDNLYNYEVTQKIKQKYFYPIFSQAAPVYKNLNLLKVAVKRSVNSVKKLRGKKI